MRGVLACTAAGAPGDAYGARTRWSSAFSRVRVLRRSGPVTQPSADDELSTIWDDRGIIIVPTRCSHSPDRGAQGITQSDAQMNEMATARITLATKAFGAARAAVQDCQTQVNEFADADENYPGDFDRDDYMESLAERLAELSKRAIDALRIVLELLDLDATREAFDSQAASFQASDFKTVGYYDEYLGANNVVVDTLSRWLERIAPLMEITTGTEKERRVLVRMLKQTAHYLHSIGQVPGREKNVQDALQPALRLAFPDVIREPPIPKQTKTYRPDFGIESIETAVEVKYADDPQKAKSAVGELYEDMKGYANSEFTLFIGLIYMTAPYVSQEQVDAELKKVGTPKNWRIYLCVGAGEPKGQAVLAKPVTAKTA